MQNSKTIRSLLASWGLEVNPDGSDFKWDQTITNACDFSNYQCQHDPQLLFTDFLDVPIDDFRSRCKLFDGPEGDTLEALFTLVNTIESVEAITEAAAFQSTMQRSFSGLEDYPDIPFLGPNRNKAMAELVREKIFAKYQQFPRQAEDVFHALISEKGKWTIPEAPAGEEELVYVSTLDPNHQVSGIMSLRPYDVIFSYFCTKVSDEIFIIPKRFLVLHNTEGLSILSPTMSWKADVVRKHQGPSEFYTLAGQVVTDIMPFEPSDDKEMLETLAVFSKSMPFKDAINAARVI